MNAVLKEKQKLLDSILTNMGSLLVAFSGGVDSTFLLKAASLVLGDRCVGAVARSSAYPRREYREALEFGENQGIKLITLDSEELDIPEFRNNPENRCYFCKRELFSKLKSIAENEKIQWIADGSNADDVHDHRPGMQAACELGIRSPLKEAGMKKDDIRIISKKLNLATWNKPSFACLSSRFPYGEEIREDKLEMVARAEEYMMSRGFRQVRVRHHEAGKSIIARIEIEKKDFGKMMKEYKGITDKLISLGYTYVTLDLAGYRTGSMNEVLEK